MGGLSTQSHDKVFRAVVCTKEGQRLRTGGGISYTRLRELLLEKISQLGMDPRAFGMHSLRAGGALLHQGLVWLIACLKGMVAGDQNLPRMAMSRIHLKHGCLLQSTWEYSPR